MTELLERAIAQLKTLPSIEQDTIAKMILAELDDREEHSLTESPNWIAVTRSKVDAAIESLEKNGGSDGETVVNRFLDKFRQARGA